MFIFETKIKNHISLKMVIFIFIGVHFGFERFCILQLYFIAHKYIDCHSIHLKWHIKANYRITDKL